MHRFLLLPLSATLLLCAAGASAAEDLAQLRERMKVNKHLVVSSYLLLSSEEETRFWPLYDAYQRELDAIDERYRILIRIYADAISADRLPDTRATELLRQQLAIDADEIALRQRHLPLVQQVLPAKTAIRYLQLEGKLRAAVRADLAATVPLIPLSDH